MEKKKKLVLFMYDKKRFLPYQGKYLFEIDKDKPFNFGPLHGFMGLANAIHADYMTSKYLRDLNQLKIYEVIVIVGKTDFNLNLIRLIKKKFPHIKLIGQFEENVRKHKLWCRSKKFLYDFYEFANLVDLMSTFHHATIDYYKLFTHKPVIYLPHAYPIEWVSKKIDKVSREEKNKYILKEGFIFGRPGQDGFLDLLNILNDENSNDFKIILTNRPIKKFDGLAIFDTLSFLRIPRLSIISRYLADFIFSFPRISIPTDIIKLKKYNLEKIYMKKYLSWFDNLQYWKESFLAVDIDSCFTVGRNVLDAAALGCPIIGYNSDFQLQLFPSLSISNELDYKNVKYLVNKLIKDENFYNSVVSYANEKIWDYSYSNSYKNFIKIQENMP